MSSVEQRARELWADWHRQRGCGQQIIDDCLSGVIQMDGLTRSLVHAALREQPDARGVVDELTEIRDEALRCANADTIGGDTDALKRAMRRLADRCDAALTAAQQPVQEGGGEVVAHGFYDPATGAYSETQRTPRWLPAVVCAAPPSAPVGVPVAQVRRGGKGAPHDALYAGLIPRGPATPEVKEGDLLYLAQQPAQAAPGDADVRELLDAMDNGDDPRPAFIRLRKRYPPKATPPGDDAAGGGL